MPTGQICQSKITDCPKNLKTMRFMAISSQGNYSQGKFEEEGVVSTHRTLATPAANTHIVQKKMGFMSHITVSLSEVRDNSRILKLKPLVGLW